MLHSLPSKILSKVLGPKKDSLFKVVHSTFEQGKFLMALKKALLVGNLKVPNAKFIMQFWPISLCSILYKLIAKVLVYIATTSSKDSYGPFQSSFTLSH